MTAPAPSGVEQHDLILRTDEFAIPATRADLLTLVRAILTKLFVESLTIRLDEPIRVTWWAAPHDTIDSTPRPVSEDELSLALARVTVDELPAELATTAWQALGEAQMAISLQGLLPSHVLVASERELKRIFGVPWATRLADFPGDAACKAFAGLRVIQSPSVSDGDFVVLGAPVPSGQLADVQHAIRVVM